MLHNLSKILLIFILLSSMVLCKELNSEEQKINSALEVLRKYGYEKNLEILNGNNYTHNPVKIIFKDLSEVNFAYSKFYAISANDDSTGNLYILINDNLRNTNIKALACLILHESNHCKYNKSDTVSEEMKAHTDEVMLYNRILDDDEGLQDKTDDRLIIRLNKLKKIYDAAIRGYITNNTNYANYLKIKE